jgi:2-dehydro-3-deoxyglucarate aldolase
MSTYFNPLKERIAQSRNCVGAWLVSNSPIMAEAMASMGFHFLVVDMEHGTADISQAETLFTVAERHGAAPLARIGSQDGELARRLLDLGAQGIIISTVQSAKEFAVFAKSCLYPPDGRRGVGISRCNRFGDEFDAYLEGFQPVLMPMIETPLGVEAATDISALPYVDGLFIGPYDLSVNLGCPGDLDAKPFQEAIDAVKSACADADKVLGIHQVDPDADALRARIDSGFGFVAYGTDILAMRGALSGALEFTAK